MVHLWGHFRYGLFDEYDHSPFKCPDEDKQRTSRCTSAVIPEYFEVKVNERGKSFRISWEEVCESTYHGNQGVNSTIQENVGGSIMSVGAHEQVRK